MQKRFGTAVVTALLDSPIAAQAKAFRPVRNVAPRTVGGVVGGGVVVGGGIGGPLGVDEVKENVAHEYRSAIPPGRDPTLRHPRSPDQTSKRRGSEGMASPDRHDIFAELDVKNQSQKMMAPCKG